ncbi:MAG TPA: GNAT family N-acetyltransferase [Chitinophagaceae bacterium]|jgi:putative acetyltransferase|nr:GNAT family N-acetyltransferase [Chitinophagaceae bacterium]
MHSIVIRTIQPSDNAALAKIIRDALTEFGANRPGTVYYDPTTDALFELFQRPGAYYLVAEVNGEIAGGGGIYPSEGLPEDTCELVKMYLIPSARGIGLGKMLIEKNLDLARQTGYKKIYLESMPELQKALQAYEKAGFRYLDGPMGNTGHFGCGRWMLKELE